MFEPAFGLFPSEILLRGACSEPLNERTFKKEDFNMKITAFFVSLISVFCLVSCNNQRASQGENGPLDRSSSIIESSSGPISSAASSVPSDDVGVPENDFHTQKQYEYLTNSNWTSIKTYVPVIHQGIDESDPKALSLKFDDVADAGNYYVQVVKGSDDFTNAETHVTTKKSYDLWNAELGQTYYFKAAASQRALAAAPVKQFKVNDLAPRNLNVGNIINVRDFGGWKSSLIPNGVVRQGLLYRCAKLDGINDEGKSIIKELNITVDIDMRDRYQVPRTSPANTEDHPVTIVRASIPSGTEAQRFEGYADVYKLIFEKIADSENNPIMIHCTHGADRTGIASFFLLALLGVSKEDCGRDYSFTRLAGEREVWHEVEFDGWVAATEKLEGATFADKMKTHLMSKGISEDTLETIREIYVPGYSRNGGNNN
ncbi:MAG: tyrosine-protein phosphatase [Pontiellaceae bacterium]|nr:tyrosine-protein phosphatase [Pontiellaceae bacterium]